MHNYSQCLSSLNSYMFYCIARSKTRSTSRTNDTIQMRRIKYFHDCSVDIKWPNRREGKAGKKSTDCLHFGCLNRSVLQKFDEGRWFCAAFPSIFNALMARDNLWQHSWKVRCCDIDKACQKTGQMGPHIKAKKKRHASTQSWTNWAALIFGELCRCDPQCIQHNPA